MTDNTPESRYEQKCEQQAKLIAERDRVTDEVTGIEREQRNLEAARQVLSEKYAALSLQIEALNPTADENIRAYMRTCAKTQEEKRARQEETRARLQAAGIDLGDVAEAAETGARRRR